VGTYTYNCSVVISITVGMCFLHLLRNVAEEEIHKKAGNRRVSWRKRSATNGMNTEEVFLGIRTFRSEEQIRHLPLHPRFTLKKRS
jgi:hypothetical protein